MESFCEACRECVGLARQSLLALSARLAGGWGFEYDPGNLRGWEGLLEPRLRASGCDTFPKAQVANGDAFFYPGGNALGDSAHGLAPLDAASVGEVHYFRVSGHR
jgi:hypothetical protein